jgi:hypothetical protein
MGFLGLYGSILSLAQALLLERTGLHAIACGSIDHPRTTELLRVQWSQNVILLMTGVIVGLLLQYLLAPTMMQIAVKCLKCAKRDFNIFVP